MSAVSPSEYKNACLLPHEAYISVCKSALRLSFSLFYIFVLPM